MSTTPRPTETTPALSATAELDAGLADVTRHDDALVGRVLREHEPAETHADRIGDAGVELVGIRCPGCRRP